MTISGKVNDDTIWIIRCLMAETVFGSVQIYTVSSITL